MVIQAQWPGASAEEMTRQVTDRIEKKLEELESLDYTKSVTVAGQTTVFVYLRDSTKASDVTPDLGSGPQHDRGHQGLIYRKASSGRASTIASAMCSAISTLSPATA